MLTPPCPLQGLIPVSAMRLYIAAEVDENIAAPFWDVQQTLLDSVTVTQTDEPTARYIESFPYTDVAEPEQVAGYVPRTGSPTKLTPLSVHSQLKAMPVYA